MCWNGYHKAVSRSSTRVKDFATESEEEQRKAFATELHGKARKKKRFDFLRLCFTVAILPLGFSSVFFDRRLGTTNET